MYKIVTLIFLLPIFCFAQKPEIKIDTNFISIDQKLIYTERNCDKGNETAISDFEKGIYNYFTYGFTVSLNEEDKNLNDKVRKYLKDKYSINYQHRGCVIFEDEKCYMKKMNQLIEKKFGKNYFEIKLEEARKKYALN